MDMHKRIFSLDNFLSNIWFLPFNLKLLTNKLFEGFIMNKYRHTITVFEYDAEELEYILIRLGNCQVYSNKITEKMLSEANVDAKKDTLNFFQVMNLLRKRKDLIVYFYSINNDNKTHIFSNFFNLNNAFEDAYHFFDDIDKIFMMCEKADNTLHISLIKKGNTLFKFTINLTEKNTIINVEWQNQYKELYNAVNNIPSLNDIISSIEFILEQYTKSDKEFYKYLEKNSIYKDRYIL